MVVLSVVKEEATHTSRVCVERSQEVGRCCNLFIINAHVSLSFHFQSNSEITYAELCLDAPGPNGNPGMIGPGGGVVVGGSGGGNIGVGSVVGGGGGWSTVDRKRRRNPMDDPASNSVIYATIDHSRMRTNGEPPAHLQPHQREIVSVRTPLLVNSQQESCV